MLTIKRGDTFAFYITLTDEAKEPLNVSSDDFRSQVRDVEDNLVAELKVEDTKIEGRYKLYAEETSSWAVTTKDPNSVLLMDIELTIDGFIRSSDTIRIRVIKDVTRDEEYSYGNTRD